jgi:ATP-binding cassette subfamily B protein RaxB
MNREQPYIPRFDDFFRTRPVILQAETSECGIACIAMIANHYGNHMDLATARTHFGTSPRGATLEDLSIYATQIGLSARGLRTEPDELRFLRTPCILHWDMNHFVVLDHVSSKWIDIRDPAAGTRRVSFGEVATRFTGVVLELTPSHDFVPAAPPPRVSIRSLLGRVDGLKGSSVQVLTLGLALELLALLAPLFMMLVVDEVLASSDRELLVALALGFGLLIVIQVALRTMRSWVLLYLSTSLDLQWLNNVLAHLLRLPLRWFQSRHLADVVSRLQSVTAIQQTLTTSFIEAVIDGVMSLLMLGVMLLYSPKLVVVVVSSICAYYFMRVFLWRALRDATEQRLANGARQESHLLEMIRGIQAVKLFSKEHERLGKWRNLAVDTSNSALHVEKLNLALRGGSSLIFGAQGILVVFIGANLCLSQQLTVGALFAFVAYKDQFTQRFTHLLDFIFQLRLLSVHAERLADVALEPAEATPTYSSQTGLPVSGAVEFCEIGFGYGTNEPWILRNFSARINPGECVGIAGPSGCGKSTLMKILLKLVVPEEGVVKVDGIDVRRVGTKLYSAVGTVMQDDCLFAGTIAENIHFFSELPDVNLVRQCARVACIDDEIEQMPMQYNTLIGDMGSTLSGGQRQRILLARALYKAPRILFLDEATSHLDVVAERRISDAIRGMNITRFVIAHRPETLSAVDRLFQYESGTFVEKSVNCS